MGELKAYIFEDDLFEWGGVILATSREEAIEIGKAYNFNTWNPAAAEIREAPIMKGILGEWGGNG